MSRVMQTVAQRVMAFADILAGRHLIDVAIGPSLEPVVLSLDGPPDYRRVTSHGSFPKKQAANPNSFRIHYRADGAWTAVDIAPTDDNYHSVQLLPEGRWLLVRGRAADEKDRNAHVCSATGRLLHSFHAGDGIEDVQTTEKGQIWASYFDEGVFGNTSLGRSGLACLDMQGRPLFRFTELGTDRLIQNMADCYAFNVCSDREAWLYYYTDFPLVRLVDQKLAGSWRMPIRGSHGFAVDGERVLLGGGYTSKDFLFLGDLATLRFEKLKPVDDKGTPLPPFQPMGRGASLHLATEEGLYRVDMASL